MVRTYRLILTEFVRFITITGKPGFASYQGKQLMSGNNQTSMEPSKKLSYFNDLTVDLNNEAYFSSEIHERTKINPNLNVSYPCHLCNDSLDEYADQLTSKILSALKG